MTWSLRRNTDKGLPATHTVEIMFKLPADFPSGGISNVPGILMKQAEQTRGVPLAGSAVKVTNGFYLIGLSNSTPTRSATFSCSRSAPGSTFRWSTTTTAAPSWPWRRARPASACSPTRSRPGSRIDWRRHGAPRWAAAPGSSSDRCHHCTGSAAAAAGERAPSPRRGSSPPAAPSRRRAPRSGARARARRRTRPPDPRA